MKKIIALIVLSLIILHAWAQVGIGTTTPGTTLDVNGGFTTRETVVNLAANAATLPANTSLVRVTGTATGTINLSVPAAPNFGQRLTIFNNTVGGFTAALNGFNIPAAQSCEFIYTNGAWQSLLPIGSSIIPYASATPSVLTTTVTGAVGTVGLVGFGNTLSGIGLTGTDIDLTGGVGISLNFGYSLPRAATIKTMSVVFSNVVALNLTGTTVALKAQLYVSNNTNNLYSPVTGASVDLTPNLTGTVTLGTIFTGSVSGLSIPIPFGSRVLFVVTGTATGLSLANTVTGYVSGGVSFD